MYTYDDKIIYDTPMYPWNELNDDVAQAIITEYAIESIRDAQDGYANFEATLTYLSFETYEPLRDYYEKVWYSNAEYIERKIGFEYVAALDADEMYFKYSESTEDFKKLQSDLKDYSERFGLKRIELNEALYDNVLMFLDEDKLREIEENVENCNLIEEINGKPYVKCFDNTKDRFLAHTAHTEKSIDFLKSFSNMLDYIIENDVIQPELLKSAICKSRYTDINGEFFPDTTANSNVDDKNFVLGLNNNELSTELSDALKKELELTGHLQFLDYQSRDAHSDENDDTLYMNPKEIGIEYTPIISQYTREDFDAFLEYSKSVGLSGNYQKNMTPETIKKGYELLVQDAKNDLQESEDSYEYYKDELETKEKALSDFLHRCDDMKLNDVATSKDSNNITDKENTVSDILGDIKPKEQQNTAQSQNKKMKM